MAPAFIHGAGGTAASCDATSRRIPLRAACCAEVAGGGGQRAKRGIKLRYLWRRKPRAVTQNRVGHRAIFGRAGWTAGHDTRAPIRVWLADASPSPLTSLPVTGAARRGQIPGDRIGALGDQKCQPCIRAKPPHPRRQLLFRRVGQDRPPVRQILYDSPVRQQSRCLASSSEEPGCPCPG